MKRITKEIASHITLLRRCPCEICQKYADKIESEYSNKDKKEEVKENI